MLENCKQLLSTSGYLFIYTYIYCIGLPNSPMDRKRMVTSVLLISCQTDSELICT